MFRVIIHIAWRCAVIAAWLPTAAWAGPATNPVLDPALDRAPTLTRPARPRIALVLSGGGARGLAQVGVLQVFEEEGIPIDAIVGSSMGAVVGGIYAAGFDADGLADIARDPNLFRSPGAWENLDAFQKWITRPRAFGLYFSGWEYRLPRALVSDVNVNRMLVEHATPANLFARSDFDSLPLPFRTQALDLKSGEVVTLRRGDLARAIRSSMAVPVAFPPIPSRNPDRLFIDPGPVNNLPVRLARDMGVDRVIAVNCVGTWDDREIGTDASLVARDLLRVLSQRVDSTTVTGWDTWIEPDVGRAGFMDWDRVETFIQAGRTAARAALPRIRSWFPPGTLPVRERRPGIAEVQRRLGALRVAWVRLEGRSSSYTWVPKRELHLGPGDPFSVDLLGRGVRRLYGTGHYEAVWPTVNLVDSGRVGISLDLEERAPAYVSLGLLYDNQRGANIDIEFLRDNLLRLGETFHGSLFVGNYRDGAEAGIRSSHLRGVPVGLDLLLRSERLRYEQVNHGDFRHIQRMVQLSTALSAGNDQLLIAGYRFVRDQGENRAEGGDGGGNRVMDGDWDARGSWLYTTFLSDDTEERELPTRGHRVVAHYQMQLRDLRHQPPASFSGLLAECVPVGRLSFFSGVEAAGLDRDDVNAAADRPFRLWHRADLTRATTGRFEPGLYARFTGKAWVVPSVRLAPNLFTWGRVSAVVRRSRIRDILTARAERGLEAGLLQRTPIGPVTVGGAFEKGRGSFLFVQVGHDLTRLP
jgi:predicted acylesterase/phospholipase RssA